MHSETSFTTTLAFAADHPAFAGHFPGTPIVPGVLLLDAVVFAAGEMRGATGVQRLGPADVTHISSAKFLSPVGPGETLTFSLNANPSGTIRFDIFSGSRQVATGTLVTGTFTPATAL